LLDCCLASGHEDTQASRSTSGRFRCDRRGAGNWNDTHSRETQAEGEKKKEKRQKKKGKRKEDVRSEQMPEDAF
jgi:hypothetical protein